MKRNLNGSLLFTSNKKFKILHHDLSNEVGTNILLVTYEVVTLYTNGGTEIEALKYVEGNAILMEFAFNESNEMVLERHIDLPFEELPRFRDFSFNCHGKTFCDSKYWLDSEDMVNLIIAEECITTAHNAKVAKGNILLLYNNDELIHSVIINEANEVEGKNGTLGLSVQSSFNEFLRIDEYEHDSLLVLDMLTEIDEFEPMYA